MKKNILLFMTAIFATILLFGVASAAITVTGTTTNLAQDSTSFDVVVTSTLNETVSLSIADIAGDSVYKIDFQDSISDLTLNAANNNTKTVTITYDVQSGFDFELGQDYTTNLIITDENGTITTKTVSFKASDFCEDNNEKDSGFDLTIEDITVETGFGDDDDYWYLRDSIKVEVFFDDPSYDIENIDIEWELWSDGKMIDDGSESMADVDENDDETIEFILKLDENMDDIDSEVTLYVRAIGEISDKDDNVDGYETCEWDSESVSVNIDKDFVIVDSLKINEQSIDYNYDVSCGQEVTISGEVWNIGTKDQDDLYVDIYSKSLGVDKRFDFDTIDSLDNEEFTYTFKVPEDMTGTSKLTIKVYDEDNDVFENDEDDQSTQTIQFKITGNCVTISPTVGAELATEAFSGEEMIVKATVRNNNPTPIVYTMVATGFEGWADSVSIEPQVISLGIAESKEVNFKFKVSSDSEGDYSFNIETMEGSKTVLVQPAAVTIEKKGLNLGMLSDKENLKLAGIIALNIIFVVLIIVVARKILRRK